MKITRVPDNLARGLERILVLNVLPHIRTTARSRVGIRIEKFADDGAVRANRPYEVSEWFEEFTALPKCMLNEGIQALEDLGAGLASPTLWNNANARTGVGDSVVAENATQTGLQAAANKLWKGMNGGYPSRASQTLSWQSDYGGAEANYAWNEFTVVNAADDSGQNLFRKVSAQGTKTAGQTWRVTLTLTIT